MMIDGIKALPSEKKEPIVWRFRYDRGTHRRVCVIQASQAEQDLLRSALRLAVFGMQAPTLQAATVQITDHNGDSWVFERQADQFRCFRNRQFFDARLEVCLKEVFKDYRGSEEKLDPLQLMREYDLSFDGQSLIALPNQASHRVTPWERAGRDRMLANLRSLEQALGITKQLSRGQLEQLLGFGEGLARKQMALQAQKKEIEKIFVQLQQLDQGLIAKLEQETQLLQKIEQCSEPLLDPKKNPRILSDRLKEVVSQLDELCQKWGVHQLPQADMDLDWGQVLQLLTRSLAMEKLEKSVRKSVHDARSTLKPVYDAYRQSIGQFLEQDHELIQELEVCLGELGQYVRTAAVEQGKQRDNLASKLNKLLNFSSLEQQAGSGLGPETLEQSRQAVNRCLHVIGQLYGDLEQHREIHDQQLAELEQRHEKIQAEAQKAREQWLGVCQRLGLPNDIDFRALVDWVNHYGKISMLHQKRLRLEEDLADFRQQGRTLAQLLEEWRILTGSQKSTRLDQLSNVLSEVRGVLQYADKKRSQLLKLQALGSKFEAYQQIRGKLDTDLDLVQKRWEQVLEHLEIPLRPFDASTWESIAQSMRENLLLDSLLREANKPLKNEQVFAAEALDAALTFYRWRGEGQSNKGRLQVLQHAEYADDAGIAFIMSSDEALVDLLLKLGVAAGQKVETKVAPISEPAPAAGVRPQKALLSEKAKAALEVFAAKQGGPSRSSL